MRKKRKVDSEALGSPFMRIPQMPVFVARYLLDAGYSELFQLQGRSAESLFEEIRKSSILIPEADTLPALRLAIYVAENPANPDRSLLNLHAWK